ncbi:helix-turn-helix domain-containing protein [Deinococcus sp. SM5_A1]|uniref:helix-turn-helix domain-containing protein n=1 Tax=Deinococcus sp. SM5_A1 TaxID=3379094 RepID=UPI00385DBCF5
MLGLDSHDLTALGLRLQGARKAVRLTQQEAADHLGVARTTIVAIEKGERRVQPAELIALAERYAVSVHELLRSRQPTGGLDVQFKAYFKKRGAADPAIGDRLEQAAALLQQSAENYLELEEAMHSPLPRNYPVEYDIGSLAPEAAADEIADAERRRLGLGDAPLGNLRETLEAEVGLRIFSLELDSRVSGLFGYTEELGGCIALNSKHPPERQRMSLAHEYAHFLTARARPDVQVFRHAGRVSDTERFAEAFARRLLMPARTVTRHLRNHVKNHGTPKVADLVHLSSYFRVSFEAYVRRLEELQVIGAGTYDRLQFENFKPREAQKLAGITQELSEPRFPKRYILLALEALDRGLITEGQAAMYLASDRLSVRDLSAQYKRQAALTEDGEPGWSSWQMDVDVAVKAR